METSATTIVVPPTAEEQRIASIADSINLADPSLTVTYGTEAMQGISRFADDLLSRVQAKDSGELGESLTNLMLKVKDVNVSEVMKRTLEAGRVAVTKFPMAFIRCVFPSPTPPYRNSGLYASPGCSATARAAA